MKPSEGLEKVSTVMMCRNDKNDNISQIGAYGVCFHPIVILLIYVWIINTDCESSQRYVLHCCTIIDVVAEQQLLIVLGSV